MERLLPTPWNLPHNSSLPLPKDTLYELLEAKIAQTNLALKQLDARTREAEETEREMEVVLEQLLAASKPPKPPTTAAAEEQFDLALHLVEFPRTPLYVKRRFEVSFKLVGEESLKCGLYPLQCTLSVRKMDSEGAEILNSRSGENYIGYPYLRGQLSKTFTEVPVMTFHRLVFNDISGVFPLGRVNIFIQCPEHPTKIKPLVIEGVRVKARKKRPDEVL